MGSGPRLVHPFDVPGGVPLPRASRADPTFRRLAAGPTASNGAGCALSLTMVFSLNRGDFVGISGWCASLMEWHIALRAPLPSVTSTSASNYISVPADPQISPRLQKLSRFAFSPEALAHWQIIASAVLLGGGVARFGGHLRRLAALTELVAPGGSRSDFEEGSKVSGFRPGVMARR